MEKLLVLVVATLVIVRGDLLTLFINLMISVIIKLMMVPTLN